MRVTTSLLAAAAIAAATPVALPQGHPQVQWSPAGPGDVRSPCPALNALANHDILPHDGKAYSIPMLVKAFKVGFNMGSDIITQAATLAMTQCSNVTGTNCTAFDLDILNVPHMNEHDASLSRQDYNYGLGDNHDFSASTWQQVLDLWADVSIIDFSLANAARKLRIANANSTDLPGWFRENDGLSFIEAGFYLSTMGDPVDGNARKDWIDYWFRFEKLPFELGWFPFQRAETNEATLDVMVVKVQNTPTT